MRRSGGGAVLVFLGIALVLGAFDPPSFRDLPVAARLPPHAFVANRRPGQVRGRVLDGRVGAEWRLLTRPLERLPVTLKPSISRSVSSRTDSSSVRIRLAVGTGLLLDQGEPFHDALARPATPDELPIVGASSTMPGVYYATGIV